MFESKMQKIKEDREDANLNCKYGRKGMTIRNPGPRRGRNELCPCGTGLKFKKCCREK